MEIAPYKDGAAPEIPWLKWRVDGLWQSIARLEKRCESLAVAVGVDGCNEGKLNCLSDRLEQLENWRARSSHYGLSLQELDTRLEQHTTAIESVCSRIYVERVQDQLKEFFNVHVSRLDDFCAQLRAETLKEAFRVHKKILSELGHMSTMEGDTMLNLDSTNSTKLEKKASSEKHQHRDASADVPTMEPRRHCAATLQHHVHPGSYHKDMPSTASSRFHRISDMNDDLGVASTCYSDCTNATNSVRRRSVSSSGMVASPVVQHRDTRICGESLSVASPPAACHNTDPESLSAVRRTMGLASPPVAFRNIDPTSPSATFRNMDHDTTKRISGIMHRRGSCSVASPPAAFRNIEPDRTNATKTGSGIRHRTASCSAESPPAAYRSIETDRTNGTKTGSGIRHRTASCSAESPPAAYRNIEPDRTDGHGSSSVGPPLALRHNAEPIMHVAAHAHSSTQGNRFGGIIASSNGLCGTLVNTVDGIPTQDSKSMLMRMRGLSDASWIRDGSCSPLAHTRAPLLVSVSGTHAGLWPH